MKLTPGSFAMPDGTFAEARRDKETGDVYISQKVNCTGYRTRRSIL